MNDFSFSGVGLMLPVNLYETLSSCQEGDTGLSDALKVTYMTSLLTDKGLTSTYPAGTIVPLKATVKCQAAESETVSVPDALEQIEEATGLKLEELTFDTGMFSVIHNIPECTKLTSLIFSVEYHSLLATSLKITSKKVQFSK